MSVMDYDPKYAKLRRWRETHGHADLLPHIQPSLQTVAVRLSCVVPAIDWKSISASMDQLAKRYGA